MSNNVNVQISANVKGFVDGMKQASDSAKQYETDQRKVADSAINFKKELGSLRREVMNLAGGYARLDQEAKNSDFGKQMKMQLDNAKQSLSEMVDMQGDMNQEIRNMASDTRTFDTMAESLGVVGNMASTAYGAIATFTGNTEDAKRAVTMFTTVQSGLSAATKIQNALQMQSNTMLAVAKIQSMAAAAAERARTSTVIGATVAQKAFNAVAKANPYVLLATAAVAATGAIWGFIKMTENAESAQDKLKREMNEASIQAQKDASAELVKLDLLYNATQNVNLTKEQRLRAVKNMKSEYPEYLKDISDEAILAGKAADKYRQLAADILKAAKARAYQNKLEQLAAENIDIGERIKKEEQELAKRQKERDRNRKYSGTIPGNTGAGALMLGENLSIDSSKKKLAELNRQQEQNKATMQEYSDIVTDLTKDIPGKNAKGGTTSGGGGSNTKTEKTELQELQTEIQKLEQEYLKLGNVSTDEANKRKAAIQSLIQQDEKRINEIKLLQEQSHGKLLGGNVDTNVNPNNNMLSYDPSKLTDISNMPPITVPVDDHPLQTLLGMLQKLREELELAPDTEAYQESLRKIAEVQDQIDNFTGDKQAKDTQKAWNGAASAMSKAGSAMNQIEDPAAKVAGTLAQAIANVILGYSEANAQAGSMGPWAWIGFALSGLATAMTVISQIKSAGSYADGGIIGGSSYSGDRLMANVNSGEMILNSRQQRKLFNMLDTSVMPQPGGSIVQVQGIIHGTDIMLVQKNTNAVRRRAGTQITF